jgi:hypothetical protein
MQHLQIAFLLVKQLFLPSLPASPPLNEDDGDVADHQDFPCMPFKENICNLLPRPLSCLSQSVQIKPRATQPLRNYHGMVDDVKLFIGDGDRLNNYRASVVSSLQQGNLFKRVSVKHGNLNTERVMAIVRLKSFISLIHLRKNRKPSRTILKLLLNPSPPLPGQGNMFW